MEPVKNSSNPSIEIVYPDPIELLDESEHHNSQVLTKKLNEVIVALNKSK